MPYYPPTVNDARMAALVQSVAQVGGRGAGPARALPPRPTHACPPHPRSVCWGRGGWRTPPRPWRARILALLRGFCLPRTPSWGSGTRTLGPSGRYTRLGASLRLHGWLACYGPSMQLRTRCWLACHGPSMQLRTRCCSDPQVHAGRARAAAGRGTAHRADAGVAGQCGRRARGALTCFGCIQSGQSTVMPHGP